MKRTTISHLTSTTIGFDKLFELLEGSVQQAGKIAFPLYNIAQDADDEHSYVVTLAVAGYAKEDILVTQHDNKLIITGKGAKLDESVKYIHRGITQKDFTRTLVLAEHSVVKSSEMVNGLLHIGVTLELPEKLKPREIKIS
ncbi:Heat-shock protein Hsp20 [Vibrio chagasii]|nr:Heat-shock protein Hsp20 [Vibrio chagasii]